jgi:hypothetical protein
MKRTITLLLLSFVGIINGQAFKGNGDIKGQVGLNVQDGGTGLFLSTDFGVGTNISLGLTANYLLSVYENTLGEIPDFGNRVDIKARFNANIGDVLKMDPKMDFYPGLDIGLHNLGGHVGFRYFFTDGFGIFGEAGTPIAKYDKTTTGFDRLNNQFVFNIGASFNL